ncbi:MAG TPA: diacylglycerol kinase [Usitatibacter sp.]|nr:diacylglycerol kinase [Usitatibacter sp.]
MTPVEPKPGVKTGYRRLVGASINSWAGLVSAWRKEAAFRQELVMAALLVPVAFLLTPVPVERALLVGATLLVMVVELLNSCVEAAIDRISLERHPLSKHAKDVGSAAVLVALVLLAAVWLIVLVPRYL